MRFKKCFAKKFKNKICRNYKVYFLHIVVSSYFSAEHRQPLASTGFWGTTLSKARLRVKLNLILLFSK